MSLAADGPQEHSDGHRPRIGVKRGCHCLWSCFLWEFPLARRAGLEPATRCLEDRFGYRTGLAVPRSAWLGDMP